MSDDTKIKNFQKFFLEKTNKTMEEYFNLKKIFAKLLIATSTVPIQNIDGYVNTPSFDEQVEEYKNFLIENLIQVTHDKTGLPKNKLHIHPFLQSGSGQASITVFDRIPDDASDVNEIRHCHEYKIIFERTQRYFKYNLKNDESDFLLWYNDTYDSEFFDDLKNYLEYLSETQSLTYEKINSSGHNGIDFLNSLGGKYKKSKKRKKSKKTKKRKSKKSRKRRKSRKY